MLVVMLILSGCSQDGASGPRPETVTGYVIAVTGEPTRLCLGAVAESFPPQCVGESLVVEGLDLSTLDGATSTRGVTFGPATLHGTIRDGVLTVN